MEIKSHQENSGQTSVKVLDIVGDITPQSGIDQLPRVVREAVEHDQNVILNCEKIRRADFAGMGWLVTSYASSLSGAGSNLVFAAPSTVLLEFLQIHKLPKVIPTFPSVKTALEDFAAAEQNECQHGEEMRGFLVGRGQQRYAIEAASIKV